MCMHVWIFVLGSMQMFIFENLEIPTNLVVASPCLKPKGSFNTKPNHSSISLLSGGILFAGSTGTCARQGACWCWYRSALLCSGLVCWLERRRGLRECSVVVSERKDLECCSGGRWSLVFYINVIVLWMLRTSKIVKLYIIFLLVRKSSNTLENILREYF